MLPKRVALGFGQGAIRTLPLRPGRRCAPEARSRFTKPRPVVYAQSQARPAAKAKVDAALSDELSDGLGTLGTQGLFLAGRPAARRHQQTRPVQAPVRDLGPR